MKHAEKHHSKFCSVHNKDLKSPQQELIICYLCLGPGSFSLYWCSSACLYRWPVPVVCLFDVLTELSVAIYPVIPPCQSSGGQANWRSGGAVTGSLICSALLSVPEACRPGERREMKAQKAKWLCLLFASAKGEQCVWISRSGVHADVPLQTLQHRPSGSICSARVQLSSGHVSVTFNIRPFWKDRTEAWNSDSSTNTLSCQSSFSFPELVYSGSLTPLLSHFQSVTQLMPHNVEEWN